MSEDDGDWRLAVELAEDHDHHAGVLDALIHGARNRDNDDAADARGAVASDVAITHDGLMLFAYANRQDVITAAKSAIESALRRDDIETRILISHSRRDRAARAERLRF